MNAVFSIILLAVALGAIVLLLTRRENTRRSQYGPTGLSEFRTDLPLDDCFDRLDEHKDTDEFVYECRRENDGGFLLHLTLHQPTQQPLDTLYTLRLDPGPLPDAEAGCPPHQIILQKSLFISRLFCYTTL